MERSNSPNSLSHRAMDGLCRGRRSRQKVNARGGKSLILAGKMNNKKKIGKKMRTRNTGIYYFVTRPELSSALVIGQEGVLSLW